MHDWTIATDDQLTERWLHCMQCQARGQRVWVEVLQVGSLAFAVTLCPPCYRQDPGFVQVQRLLEQRYAEFAMAGRARMEHL